VCEWVRERERERALKPWTWSDLFELTQYILKYLFLALDLVKVYWSASVLLLTRLVNRISQWCLTISSERIMFSSFDHQASPIIDQIKIIIFSSFMFAACICGCGSTQPIKIYGVASHFAWLRRPNSGHIRVNWNVNEVR
jgi:hypothetical protein